MMWLNNYDIDVNVEGSKTLIGISIDHVAIFVYKNGKEILRIIIKDKY